MNRPRKEIFVTVCAAVAVFVTVALGLALRLVDPLSSTVIPAEDPFTHMALIRQHMETGALNGLDEGTGLYPPGMHAFLAAVWAYGGMELYELTRIGPAAFGALGVMGMALLLWRHLGPIGGFVGGLGYAVAPEVIFRTSMMSPTAVDLALVPFLLFALLEIAAGRMRWLTIAIPMAAFFVFAHPWLLGILVLAMAVFIVLSILAPGTGPERPRADLLGLACVVAVIGGGFGIAMTTCAGYCGPGMVDFLPGFLHAAWVASFVIAASVAPALLIAAHPGRLERFLPRGPRRRVPFWVKLPIAVLIAAAVVMVSLPAFAAGLPEQVDLVRMFGYPILIVGALGLVMMPFLSNRISHVGAGLVAATYPLVIYDVFDSPFWPHRTAVFFGIGIMVLVGVAAVGITKAVVAVAATTHRALSRPRPLGRPSEPGFSALLAVPAILVVASLGGTVYSATPDVYSGGWYRMYPECELDALREIGSDIEDEPAALIVAGSWEARLALMGTGVSPDNAWYDPNFFLDYDRREDTLAIQAKDQGAVYVVIDRHMLGNDQIDRTDLDFLDEDVWKDYDSWCAGQGVPQPRVELHSTGGPPA